MKVVIFVVWAVFTDTSGYGSPVALTSKGLPGTYTMEQCKDFERRVAGSKRFPERKSTIVTFVRCYPLPGGGK